MKFDLRQDGRLSIDQAKEITEIEKNIRGEYTEYITKIVTENDVSGLGWLVRVTSRDPYSTGVFDSLCRLRLFESYLARGEIAEEVLVDDEAFASIVTDVCNKHGSNVEIVIDGAHGVGMLLVFSNFLKAVYYSLSGFLCAKVVRGKSTPRKPIIYLDTFTTHSWINSNGELEDKYFPGLIDALDNEEMRESVWYAPVLHSVKKPKQFIKLIKAIRKSECNYLLMEDWITLIDLCSAFFLSWNLPKKIKNIPDFYGINIQTLIRREIYLDTCSPSLVASILRYKFIRRLSEKRVSLDLVVDWNENQIIDRALNLAVRKFYPNTCVVGYQGFIVSEHYISHEPTSCEVEAGTVPDKLCVVDEKLIQRKKKFCPTVHVETAPAFRFQSLLNHSPFGHEEKRVILVALTMNLDMCRRMLQLCMSVDYKGFEFHLKPHPAVDVHSLTKAIPEALDERFVITTSSLYSIFPKASLLISSDSSSCYEAVYCGVPVVIVGNLSGPTTNPLEGVVEGAHWKVCYTGKCIQEMLNKIDHGPIQKIDNRLIPVTNDSVINFLKCEKQ